MISIGRLNQRKVAMMTRLPLRSAVLASVLMGFIWTAPLGAQQLGHRVLGTLGLLAGSQPDSGWYVIDLFASYGSNEVFDREGHRIPVGLDLDALSNPIGFQAIFKLTPSLYMNLSAAAPIAHVRLGSDQPGVSLDEFGFGDVYIQPLKIGWKRTQADVVGGYAFYAPSGLYVPRNGGIGLGQWTHQFSLGGAAYFDRAKTWNISALTSYLLNQRKQGIDITRGDTIQFQGGAGKTLRRTSRLLPGLDIGLAAYGLWQVRADRGADLPDALRGARELDLGLGPEMDFTVPAIRSRITLRYCRDIEAKARQKGQILVIQLAIVARR
jgi:hypothetical protein